MGLLYPHSRGRRRGTSRHKGGPSHARLRRELSRLTGNSRDADENLAGGALNLAARELFATLEVLLAMRAGKLEIGHKLVLFDE